MFVYAIDRMKAESGRVRYSITPALARRAAFPGRGSGDSGLAGCERGT